MDGLRQVLVRIREQLSVMTRSQQVAIGLCAVIIMGSMLWLTQWSTRPQLAPLLDQSMTAQEMNTAVQHLEGIRAEFEERGDRIYVKPDERRKLHRELSGAGALPQDTSLGFENLLADQSPFQPESINRRNYLIALQNELAAVMTGDPKVASAKVFINEFKSRRAGPLQNLEPTAAVTVRTKSGKQIDGPAVQAMADLVSGAVAGLAPHNVNVSVDGRPRSIPGPEDLVSYGLLDEKKKNEKHFAEKIYDLLSYIPGVKVAVAVELDTTRRHVEKRKYDDQVPKIERETTDESDSGTPAGEAGVNPNTGPALSNSGSGQSTSRGESQTEYYPQNAVEIATEEHPPFQVAGVTASINIPRSYFVSV
ncbi:MAG: hypothetical protein GY778_21810, partial [bacterium]|nr:hypothetical protein [bacterium]